MENPDYEFAIYWNRAMLKIVGLWNESEEKTSLLLTCKFYGSALLILYFIFLPQTAYLFVTYSDIDMVIDILTTADLTISVTLIKHFTFWCKKKELQSLIAFMKEDWINTKNEIHLAKMSKNVQKGRFITISLTILTQFMAFIFAITNIYMLSSGSFKKQFFYLSYYPFDAYSTPVYEITCFFQLYSAILATLIYTNVDSFIAILLLHICGQLNILQYELQHLTDPAVNGNKNAIDIIRINLRFITQRHEHLIRNVKTIENCFNLMFLVVMVYLSLELCLQGFSIYNAIVNKGMINILQLTFLCVFIMALISLFYLYCYIGDQLCSESLEIGNAAYKCDWFYLPPSEIKSLIIIILRANVPICITAGKFCTFTMVTFSEVIKRSFGYMSVLLSMKA